MKKFLLLLVFVSFLPSAQVNRFIYEYKFIPDSTKRDEVKTEMMLLDISKEGSKYFSHEKFVADSLVKADVDRQIAAGSNNININRSHKEAQVNYSVEKVYPDFEVFLLERISMDNYKIEESEVPQWKILPETQQIGAYKAQKATTDFGGRSWTAWFAAALPFQDGPYKFYGLPGLIVKVEDSTLSHIMSLVGNKSIANTFSTDFTLPSRAQSSGIDGKSIAVNEEQFKKLWSDYLRDPAKNIRELMMKNSADSKVVIKMKTSDGRELSEMNEIYRNMEKRVKENAKANNNRIEPDLYR